MLVKVVAHLDTINSQAAAGNPHEDASRRVADDCCHKISTCAPMSQGTIL